MTAEGEAAAAKLTSERVRAHFEVDAAEQRSLNEAVNIPSTDQVSMQTKVALPEALPDIIRESAKPMEAIDSIKIVQVEGLVGDSGASGGTDGSNGSNGNLADAAMTAVLRYRTQAFMIDNLLRALGLTEKALASRLQEVSVSRWKMPPVSRRWAQRRSLYGHRHHRRVRTVADVGATHSCFRYRLDTRPPTVEQQCDQAGGC